MQNISFVPQAYEQHDKIVKRSFEPTLLDVHLTYKDKASIRIQVLESLLQQKLSGLEQYLNLVRKNSYEYTEQELRNFNLVRVAFKNYIKWVKVKIQVFQDMLNRMDGKRDKAREREKELQLNFIKMLDSEVDQQAYHLINTTKKIYNINQMQIYRQDNQLISTKHVGPAEFNGFPISEILSTGIELYCTKLDPDAFWLDRSFLIELIQSKEPSLLKSILFDTFAKHKAVATYGANYQHLQDHSFVEGLLPHCYDNPSRESLIALMLLCLEEGWRFNSIKKKMYLGKAFRMAEILGLDPDQNEGLDTDGSSWKSQIWQALFYVHSVVFTSVPWPPLFRTKKRMQFNHLYQSTYCIPTLIRTVKCIADTEKNMEPNKNTVKSIPSIKLKSTPKVAFDESKKYYKQVLRKGMLQSQILLNLHTNYHQNNTANLTIDITTDEFKTIEKEINTLIKKTPKRILTPIVAPEFYLCNQMVHKAFSFSQPYMSAMSYNGLLTMKISLYYPLALINPRPQPFSNLTACAQALDAADKLYDFFIQFIYQYLKMERPSKVQPVNLTDTLPAIFTYLNAIIQNSVDTWQFHRVLGKAQTLVDGLQEIVNSQKATLDSKSTLKELLNALPNFNLPPPYKLVIGTQGECTS